MLNDCVWKGDFESAKVDFLKILCYNNANVNKVWEVYSAMSDKNGGVKGYLPILTIICCLAVMLIGFNVDSDIGGALAFTGLMGFFAFVITSNFTANEIIWYVVLAIISSINLIIGFMGTTIVQAVVGIIEMSSIYIFAFLIRFIYGKNQGYRRYDSKKK